MGIDSDINRSWKEFNDYINSKENREKCKPFLLDCQRFAATAERYKDQCQLFFDELVDEVVREEYAVGGEILHRGYYCPSPILDIVVGNGNRGKLLKRLTSRSHPTYIYRFNKDDRLIIVENQNGIKEIILRDGSIETGIEFSKRCEILSLTECIYSGSQIQSYSHCLYDSNTKISDNYHLENYKYSMDGLESADLFRFSNFRNKPLIRHDKYLFQHDEEGFLSHYKLIEYDERNRAKEDSYTKDRIYDVYLKRKV